MPTEWVYLGHDNAIRVKILSNGSAVDLSATTRVTLTVSTVLIASTNHATQALTWAKAGYDTGEVRIRLGDNTAISAGDYEAPIVLYDATETDGVYWGDITLKVRGKVEAS
jgi:hypothetical protein